MANLIETLDLQRTVRAAAFKKAAQIYTAANIERGWGEKPTVNQIKNVFRRGYILLAKKHPRTRWLNLEKNPPPKWISKLDYIAARGGKPIMNELLEIIKNLNNTPMEIRTRTSIQPQLPFFRYKEIEYDPTKDNACPDGRTL